MISTLQKRLQYVLLSLVGPSSLFRIVSHIGRDTREVLVTQAMMIETRRAPACEVSLFPLWCKGGKHRPRHRAKVAISVQRDQDQEDGKTEVIVEPKTMSPPELFAGEDHFCQDSLY